MATRRHFLKHLGRLAASAPLAKYGAMTARAQTTGNFKALVCIFLFGGNDSNNTVVPMSAPEYRNYQAGRRSVALPQAVLLPIGASGGRAYGFHPRLTNIQRIYAQKKAAVVLNTGTLIRPITQADLARDGNTPKNLYSHSDQTAEWQAGNANGPAGTGWCGRILDAMGSTTSGLMPPAISVNGNALQLVGASTSPVSIGDDSEFGLEGLGDDPTDLARDAALSQVFTFDSGVRLIGAANQLVAAGLKNVEELNRVLNSAPALRTVFPNSGLGGQLLQVAKLIALRTTLGMTRQVFFAGMGGFDNHTNLLSSHDGLLGTVDAAVGAFYSATQELGVENAVTTFTESEFNRTFTPNSDAGTDHAWGGNHIVVGGAVRGGEAYGSLPRLLPGGPDDAGNRGLWIPSLAMDQYGATFASWFGVADTSLPTVFPNIANFSNRKLTFL